ncbi:MAG: hypothetical protein OEW77_06280 [Gemmatimonadota bacterium]|nr:hypothetical protein [Gemmatimonadota bacterium]
MRRVAPFVFVWLAALAGCGGPTQVMGSVRFGEPFELKVGQSVVLGERQETLRFLAVLEDSRCPTDALIQCVWAGRVRLRVAVAPLSGDELPLELHLGDEPSSAVFGDLRLELLDVKPAARLDLIPTGEYRATFRITLAR